MILGALIGGEIVSSEEQVQCDRNGCEEWFVKRTHNQKYHSKQCTRLATNGKIMEKYYERRAQKLGKTRICKTCQITKLSRYNDSQICASCKSKTEYDINNSVIQMLERASLR